MVLLLVLVLRFVGAGETVVLSPRLDTGLLQALTFAFRFRGVLEGHLAFVLLAGFQPFTQALEAGSPQELF